MNKNSISQFFLEYHCKRHLDKFAPSCNQSQSAHTDGREGEQVLYTDFRHFVRPVP